MSRPAEQLYLVCGMHRSASTWVYNAVRILLEAQLKDPEQLRAGWIDDCVDQPRAPVNLWKLHEFDAALASESNLNFYSFRDIRDVLASRARKFGTKVTVGSAKELIKTHDLWMPHADVVIQYEEMLQNPTNSLATLAAALSIKDPDLGAIEQALGELDFSAPGEKNERYHKRNLFHAGHITHGGVGSWQGQVSDETIMSIEKACQDWFRRWGYPLHFIEESGGVT